MTIAALDDAVAWRGTVGTCADGGASLELTKDGGKSWTKVSAPAGAVVRIQPTAPSRAFAIGAGADCELRQFTSNDSGKAWEGPQALDGAWAKRLDSQTEVITPKKPKARPCGDTPVLDLSRTSADQAESLCASGDVKVTNDGGISWSDSGKAPGGIAISNRLESSVLSTYVARVVDSCDGIQIVKVIQGADARAIACVQLKEAAGKGAVALSVTNVSGWLRVGNDTWTAPAALDAWRRA